MSAAYHFNQVIREFSELVKLDYPAHFLATGLLNIDGKEMLLLYDEKFGSDRLQIRIDLGPVANQINPGAIIVGLLIANFTCGLGGKFMFSLNPEDGHVVITIQENFSENTTAKTLQDMLQQWADEANANWQMVLEKFSSITTSNFAQGIKI